MTNERDGDEDKQLEGVDEDEQGVSGDSQSPPYPQRLQKAQDASGGAKEEFETAESNREGWKKINAGFKEEGRENRPDVGRDDSAAESPSDVNTKP